MRRSSEKRCRALECVYIRRRHPPAVSSCLSRKSSRSDPLGRSMRKVTFGGANSLDNFIARPDPSVDWLMWGKEAAAYTADFWKSIDTVLMGRKTYEVAVASGQGRGYPGVKNFVFSRTLREVPDGVTIVREDAV